MMTSVLVAWTMGDDSSPRNRYITAYDAAAHHDHYHHYPASPGTVGRGLNSRAAVARVSGETASISRNEAI